MSKHERSAGEGGDRDRPEQLIRAARAGDVVAAALLLDSFADHVDREETPPAELQRYLADCFREITGTPCIGSPPRVTGGSFRTFRQLEVSLRDRRRTRDANRALRLVGRKGAKAEQDKALRDGAVAWMVRVAWNRLGTYNAAVEEVAEQMACDTRTVARAWSRFKDQL